MDNQRKFFFVNLTCLKQPIFFFKLLQDVDSNIQINEFGFGTSLHIRCEWTGQRSPIRYRWAILVTGFKIGFRFYLWWKAILLVTSEL